MTANRYDTLDGWRGLAALAIAFYHLPVAHAFRDLSGWKNLEFFVDFFFVLSGFVICHAWGKRLLTGQDGIVFLQRRFWRVWPLHIIILGAFFLLESAKWLALQKSSGLGADPAFSGPTSVPALLSNILMLQSLNLHGTTTWNGPAWSISAEFWTYLAFAAVMLFARGRLAAMVLIALGGAAIVAIFSPIWLFATHDFGLPRALYGFFAGAITYRLMRLWRVGALAAPGLALEAGVLVTAGLWMALTGKNASSMLAPLVFAAIVMVFSHGTGAISRFLRSKPVQALGLWSYSIYLVHTLIYFGLRFGLVTVEKMTGWKLTFSGDGTLRIFTFGSDLANGAVILALLGLTVAISAYAYRFIEKPFMMMDGSAAKAGKRPEQVSMALR
ncbi:MAG: acyltransferase [Methylobacterium sp.]|nr:acyltransferase [Methylobacterium sp.]MCA3603924.1 acyltransferase [Methylobacterium sp.]MCA3616273.1 acyltransferase [Methylobacterium sp.]MCA3628430.1 acyltransferase [Methylobacterium sp.]MCA4910944.1 acyltransferase [Methylobacterium sp.]